LRTLLKTRLVFLGGVYATDTFTDLIRNWPRGDPSLTLEVDRGWQTLAGGPFTTVQDQGHPGRSAWGVGRSGAADRGSAALAYRLVANPHEAAVLEATMGGLVVRAGAALTVAVTGAVVFAATYVSTP